MFLQTRRSYYYCRLYTQKLKITTNVSCKSHDNSSTVFVLLFFLYVKPVGKKTKHNMFTTSTSLHNCLPFYFILLKAGDTLNDDHSVNEDEPLKGPKQDESSAGSEHENNDAWKQRLEQTVRRDESEKRPKQAESLAANEEENKDAETTERRKPSTVPVKRISERIRSRDNLQSVQVSQGLLNSLVTIFLLVYFNSTDNR